MMLTTQTNRDALGVKLGHRRKLQRRIANARGIAPNTVLVAQPSVEDVVRSETQRPDAPTLMSSESRDHVADGVSVVQKRKYRRHPKPDDNAPERPPSAYVLFSNKMREDLKDQNLTFTEIAKLVGENWQGLTPAEKEPFERQAQATKEKYNYDLAEYKKTEKHREYLQYLQDFKAKHGNPSQDRMGPGKRVRLSGSGFELNGAACPAIRGIRAGSIGVNPAKGPVRQPRTGAIVSNGEPYSVPSVITTLQRTPDCLDGNSTVASPKGGYFDRRRDPSPNFVLSPRDVSTPPPLSLRKEPSHIGTTRSEGPIPTCHLPSLSDMLDNRSLCNGTTHFVEPAGPNFATLPRGHQTYSPAPPSSVSGSESRTPSLRKEPISAGSISSGSIPSGSISSGSISSGSISSGSSYNCFPRTPTEGPLPIHALLTGGGKQSGPHEYYSASPAMQRSMSPDDRTPPIVLPPRERIASDSASEAHSVMRQVNSESGIPPPHSTAHYISGGPTLLSRVPPFEQYLNGDHRLAPLVTTLSGSQVAHGLSSSGLRLRKGEVGLDGISALLQADKLVDGWLD